MLGIIKGDIRYEALAKMLPSVLSGDLYDFIGIDTLLLPFGESIDPSAKAATAFTTGVHYGIYFTIALIILGLIISLGLRKKKITTKSGAPNISKEAPL